MAQTKKKKKGLFRKLKIGKFIARNVRGAARKLAEKTNNPLLKAALGKVSKTQFGKDKFSRITKRFTENKQRKIPSTPAMQSLAMKEMMMQGVPGPEAGALAFQGAIADPENDTQESNFNPNLPQPIPTNNMAETTMTNTTPKMPFFKRVAFTAGDKPITNGQLIVSLGVGAAVIAGVVYAIRASKKNRVGSAGRPRTSAVAKKKVTRPKKK